MRKKIPSGVDDFGPIAKEGYYVDKTFIIPRILGYLEGTTILITRPRRFGKSLMVSMLDYFFSNSRGGKELFSSLFIKSDSVSMEEQGKYPVIRLTLKDAKQDSWDGMFALVRRDLCFLARRFPELLDSSSLSAYQKEEFRQLCEEGSPNVVFDKSLLKLCELLHLHYGTKPILLVDEYDAPISKAYECGFYDKAIGFFRSLYGSALKGNEHLRFALVTGVMQIAKESLFSDLNNLCVDNVMEGPFSDCFGFDEKEAQDLLGYYGLSEHKDEVMDWYGGFNVGGKRLCNPWSLLKFVERDGKLGSYWADTGENSILADIILAMDYDSVEGFSGLLGGEAIECQVSSSFSFKDISNNGNIAFSYLLFAGYLSFEALPDRLGRALLKIPNMEVKTAFEVKVIERFGPKGNLLAWPRKLKAAMKGCDSTAIGELLSEYLLKTLSYYAYSDWRSYQYLILGMTAALFSGSLVKSEVNAKKGRLDILVFSAQERFGLVIEVKMVGSKQSAYNLRRSAQAALSQIKNNRYQEDLKERGAGNVIGVGIAAFQDSAIAVSEKLL